MINYAEEMRKMDALPEPVMQLRAFDGETQVACFRGKGKASGAAAKSFTDRGWRVEIWTESEEFGTYMGAEMFPAGQG